MTRVAISLGSNLGDRATNLQKAVTALEARLSILATSNIYETSPMYVESQPPFLNAALLAETDLGPLALLRFLKDTERSVGRIPTDRNGPREIDLDLITYGVLKYRFRALGVEALVLPHPRVAERRFVLQPLNDIDPKGSILGLGKIGDLLVATEMQAATVRKVSDALLPILSR